MPLVKIIITLTTLGAINELTAYTIYVYCVHAAPFEPQNQERARGAAWGCQKHHRRHFACAHCLSLSARRSNGGVAQYIYMYVRPRVRLKTFSYMCIYGNIRAHKHLIRGIDARSYARRNLWILQITNYVSFATQFSEMRAARLRWAPYTLYTHLAYRGCKIWGCAGWSGCCELLFISVLCGIWEKAHSCSRYFLSYYYDYLPGRYFWCFEYFVYLASTRGHLRLARSSFDATRAEVCFTCFLKLGTFHRPSLRINIRQ